MSTARTVTSRAALTAPASTSPSNTVAPPLARSPARPCRARGRAGVSRGPGPATRAADRLGAGHHELPDRAVKGELPVGRLLEQAAEDSRYLWNCVKESLPSKCFY